MIQFNAPDPHYGESTLGRWWRETFKGAASASSFSSSGSESIGELVLPTSKWPDSIPTDRAAQAEWVDVEEVQITTHDNVVLYGEQVASAMLQYVPIKDRKYVINFHGNGFHLSDSHNERIEKAKNCQCVVVSFNYRGVTEGTPKAKKYQDLVVDGIAQVQRLIAEGVDPENITLDGFSLGGAIATLVAAHCHKQDQKVSVFNDRSFGTLAKEIAHLVTHEAPILTDTVESSIAQTLSLTAWAIKASVAYVSIPAEYRGHMFIGPQDHSNPGDGVIMDKATLHAQIPEHAHGLCWQMNANPQSPTNGHCQSRGSLSTVKEPLITGEEVFRTFLNRPR